MVTLLMTLSDSSHPKSPLSLGSSCTIAYSDFVAQLSCVLSDSFVIDDCQ